MPRIPVKDKQKITGVILAGGLARRMGRIDKGLIVINRRPLIEYVIEALKPQVDKLIINANRNQEIYESYGYPVVPDRYAGFQGPLAGMSSCMAVVETDFILTVPCDSPFIPPDLGARLYRRLKQGGADISVATNGRRIQPVFALIRVTLMHQLLGFLERGERRIDKWYGEQHMVKVDFSDAKQTFVNINTPEKLSMVETVIESDGS
jgi:molybdopterin-guanine dinucleotide biosynthesis protein A